MRLIASLLCTVLCVWTTIAEGSEFSERARKWFSEIPADQQKFFEWETKSIEEGAASGDAKSQYILGVSCLLDDKIDYAGALHWLGKAAEQGHAMASFILGSMYEDGEGVGRDQAKAHELYERAARNGEPKAMLNLGNIYLEGRGVPVDKARALECGFSRQRKKDLHTHNIMPAACI